MFKLEQICTMKSAIYYAEYWILCFDLQYNIMSGGGIPRLK